MVRCQTVYSDPISDKYRLWLFIPGIGMLIGIVGALVLLAEKATGPLPVVWGIVTGFCGWGLFVAMTAQNIEYGRQAHGKLTTEEYVELVELTVITVFFSLMYFAFTDPTKDWTIPRALFVGLGVLFWVIKIYSSYYFARKHR